MIREARWPRALLLVPLLGIMLHTGYIGLDFGQHWDEQAQLVLVGISAKTGVLLPNVYNYPCVTYWLATFAVVPHVLKDLGQLFHQDTRALHAYIVGDHSYMLRARTLFLVVSSSSVLWLFLLVHRWRRRAGEAFLAAAFFGLSWEFAYHSRWIAPDAVMTSFTAMTVMFCVFSRVTAHGRRYLHGAAIAAGLATGTKYQCGLLLLPVAIATVQGWRRPEGWRSLLRSIARVLGLFALTYSITTPGTWLDPSRFIFYFLMVTRHYSGGGHQGYDVPAGAVHLGKMLTYFGRDFLSPYPAASLTLTALALIGAWSLWRRSRSIAILVLSFPTAFVAFMASQRVMVIRNILPVTPFLAILAARGVTEVLEAVRVRAGRAAVVAVATVVAVIVSANASWLYRTAFSIRRATPQTALRDLARYVTEHPKKRVFASAPVRAGLATIGFDPARLTKSVADADEVATYPDDWIDILARPCNIPGVVETWFGPWEVNWSYYTTWFGFQRILLIPKDKAKVYNGPLFAT